LEAHRALPAEEATNVLVDSEDDEPEVVHDAAAAREAARCIFTILRRLKALRPRLIAVEAEAEEGLKTASVEAFKQLLERQTQLEGIQQILEDELSEQSTRYAVAAIGLSRDELEEPSRHLSGAFSVSASLRSGSGESDIDQIVGDQLRQVALSALGSLDLDEAKTLLTKIRHVGPQDVVEGLSLESAVQTKEELELVGFVSKISEGVAFSSEPARRQPIPQSVRHEVWRRDQGRCVDCGARERLEFDHIVPVSKGGSNTARNIELRCESCNRRKGAMI
jgi:hypothetical protein